MDSNVTHKLIVDKLIEMKMHETKIEKDLFEYVSSDIIDCYNQLIQLRKDCIEKYSKFYSLFFSDDDEIDVLKNYKLMLEKQNNEINEWNKEVNAIKELKCAFDELDDKEFEQELRNEFDKILAL